MYHLVENSRLSTGKSFPNTLCKKKVKESEAP